MELPHMNAINLFAPCVIASMQIHGVALDDNIKKAYTDIFSTDPTSAFGGIIAFNRELDEKLQN